MESSNEPTILVCRGSDHDACMKVLNAAKNRKSPPPKPNPPEIVVFREGTIPGETSIFSRLAEWLFGCRHDWETLSRKSCRGIEWETIHSNSGPSPMPISNHAVDRVCLKCGKRDNQIEQYRKDCIAAADEAERRQVLAKSLAHETQHTPPKDAGSDPARQCGPHRLPD